MGNEVQDTEFISPKEHSRRFEEHVEKVSSAMAVRDFNEQQKDLRSHAGQDGRSLPKADPLAEEIVVTTLTRIYNKTLFYPSFAKNYQDLAKGIFYKVGEEELDNIYGGVRQRLSPGVDLRTTAQNALDLILKGLPDSFYTDKIKEKSVAAEIAAEHKVETDEVFRDDKLYGELVSKTVRPEIEPDLFSPEKLNELLKPKK